MHATSSAHTAHTHTVIDHGHTCRLCGDTDVTYVSVEVMMLYPDVIVDSKMAAACWMLLEGLNVFQYLDASPLR